MAMVAAEQGWTISTATCFNRARSLWPGLSVPPFPRAKFAREIALVTVHGGAESLATLLDTTVRPLIRERVLEPVLAQVPFLRQHGFIMLDSDAD